MKFIIILAMVIGLFSCSTIPETPSKPIVETTIKGELRTLIKDVVKVSPCAKYNWKNRGVAPLAYMNGMALMYSKQVCGQGSKVADAKVMTGKNSLGRSYEDALSYYGLPGNELNTYTFLIGLGMRESSGRFGVGRDFSRNFVKSDSAEAGLFQMAYVARVFNAELKPLYMEFKSGKRSCELATFKDAKSSRVKSTDSKTYGNSGDEGYKWQQLMKRCPAASAAWAAVLIRSQRRHFGPIIRKEVEFKTQCKTMLQKVEAIARPRCAQL